ncbi:MAG: hypothetical protein FJX74_08380 [Armatimonadetes bacterium]|nr:hypothetical protein [Armatimonadota bacterium]
MAAALIVLLAGGLARCADYYVDPARGGDTNPGSLEAPWQHFRTAARIVQPGDTVFLREGRYTEDALFTVTAGTAEHPITVRPYPGETPVLTGGGDWGQMFHLNHDHYVLEGLTFEDTTCGNVVFMNHSQHCTVRDCTFRRQTGTMILLRGGGYHTIRDCDFDTTGSPEGGGDGDHVYVTGSQHNLIEGNHFVRAGHAVCDIIEYGEERSHHNIVRANLIEQHWGGGLYVSRLSYRNLLEDNRILYVGEEMEYPKAPVQLAADDNIVRRNLMLATGATPYAHNGVLLAAYRFSGMDQHCRNNAVYHNVLYRVGRTALMVTQRQACQATGNHVLNNILYRCRTAGPAEPWWPAGNYYLAFETYHAFADNKWVEFPNGNAFHHNLVLHADGAGEQPGEDPLVFYEQEGWGHSLAWVQGQFPAWIHDNLEASPGFVDAESGDFRLEPDSAAIDRGDFLTRTREAGTDVTQIPVLEARFFCDGWGRIPGDMVRVGDNALVRVTAVDEAAQRLTLETPVSFAAGDPVSLPWRGVRPDLGAYEAETP